MDKERVKGNGFEVEILGHSASGIRDIDPDNPELKMADLASADALSRYTERADAVDTLLSWVRGGREDEKVRAALLKMGENLGRIIERLMDWSYWRNTEKVFIGGGLSEGASGDVLIRQAEKHLSKVLDISVDLRKIHYHPAVAGLVGSTYFLPREVKGEPSLTVDLGGGNLRTGLITSVPGPEQDPVHYSKLLNWRKLNLDRKSLVNLIAREILDCLKIGKEIGLKISKFGGLAIPALIDEEGYVIGKDRNLPGDWTSPGFHLPSILEAEIEEKGFESIKFIARNDVVCQGLSEIPFIEGVKEWGVLTVGTGLGNARFRNRKL